MPTQRRIFLVRMTKSDLTCGSNGWEHAIYFASVKAPGKIVGLYPDPNYVPQKMPGEQGTYGWIPEKPNTPMYFSDVTDLHYLTDRDCIRRTAQKYFNISTEANPFLNGDFILVSVGKNGGSPEIDVSFPIEYET
jgi:hypothetical protein